MRLPSSSLYTTTYVSKQFIPPKIQIFILDFYRCIDGLYFFSQNRWIFILDFPNEPDTDWHHIVWFSQNIPRHAFILWVAMNRRFKTDDKLRFWEAYPTLSCGFCHNGSDSHDHLFFECPYPNQIWNGLKPKLNLHVVTDNWTDIIKDFRQAAKGKSIWPIIRRLVLGGTVYHLCQERNDRIFQNKGRSYDMVVKTSSDDVRSRIISLNLRHSSNVTHVRLVWNLPQGFQYDLLDVSGQDLLCLYCFYRQLILSSCFVVLVGSWFVQGPLDWFFLLAVVVSLSPFPRVHSVLYCILLFFSLINFDGFRPFTKTNFLQPVI